MRAKRSRVPALALSVLLASAAVTGCGSAAEQIDTSGIDELVIPTPDVEPDDFSSAGTNEWFPLERGSTSRYRHRGDTVATETEISVLDDEVTIAGVRTTPVRKVVRSGQEVLTETTSWYAADNVGNVWLFGEEVSATVNGQASVQSSWKAGESDAEAGLVMPAEPRIGDGFAAGADEGGITAQAEILEVEDSVEVEAGAFETVVVLSVTQEALPGITENRSYAPGVGLVHVEQTGEATGDIELISRTD